MTVTGRVLFIGFTRGSFQTHFRLKHQAACNKGVKVLLIFALVSPSKKGERTANPNFKN